MATLLFSVMALLPARPAFAATYTLTHVPPTIAYAGEDLTLPYQITQTCLFHCLLTVTLHYLTPWGTWDSKVNSVGFAGAGPYTTNFTVPADSVRAIYHAATDTPVLQYWAELYNPADGGTARAPSVGNFSVPVLDHVNGVFTNPNDQPVSGVQWQLFWLHTGVSPWVAPTLVTSGTTNSDGVVDFNITPNAQMLTEANDNDGILNFELSGVCFKTTLLGDACTPDPSATEGQYWAVARGLYANVANEREDAASSGLSTVEHEPFQLMEGAAATSNTTASSCPSGWTWEDEAPSVLTELAEIHTDYGLQGTYSYGKTADSDIELGVKIEDGTWKGSGGSIHVGNGTSAALSTSFSNNNGAGPTLSKVSGYMKIVQVRYQQWIGSGDERYCQTVRKTYADSWNKSAGLHREEFTESGSCPLDRSWGTCANHASTPAAYWQDNTLHTGWQTAKESNHKFGGTACFYVCVTAQSGHSTLSVLSWYTYISCQSGWHWYSDGVKDPHAADLVYADAGSADGGTQGNSSVPLGC